MIVYIIAVVVIIVVGLLFLMKGKPPPPPSEKEQTKPEVQTRELVNQTPDPLQEKKEIGRRKRK